MSQLHAEAVITTWQHRPRELARQLLQQFGEPDEVTRKRLTWYRKPIMAAGTSAKAFRPPDGRWRVQLTLCDEELPSATYPDGCDEPGRKLMRPPVSHPELARAGRIRGIEERAKWDSRVG